LFINEVVRYISFSEPTRGEVRAYVGQRLVTRGYKIAGFINTKLIDQQPVGDGTTAFVYLVRGVGI